MSDDWHLPGDPPISVAVRRNARARRMSLRVSGVDGRVCLTLPLRASQRAALQFVREKEPWIRSKLERQPQPIRPVPGGEVLLEGRMVPIATGPRRGVGFEKGVILVPAQTNRPAASLAGFLRTIARERLAAAVASHATALGLEYGRITLRDPRSRWGSCSSEGNLMFSWRLIMAPPSVLDYVALHEVAHLAEMNHSRAFWAIVEGAMPDYRGHRDWLRENGVTLHRYRFTD